MLILRLLSFIFLCLILPGAARSAPLPKATQEVLKKLRLDASILGDLDKELEVPKEWLEKAKKEGKVRILSTFEPQETKALSEVFRERYPFITIETSEASRETRSVKALVAYKSGRVVADILSGMGSHIPAYEEADALYDLRTIPNFKNVPEGARDAQGRWVGVYKLYWCMTYNTNLVKKEALPKQWDDLLTAPQWRNGNLAVGSRPNLWLLQLWKAKGEAWARNFMARLFNDVKPQLRKEGMSALVTLLAAGEFHAAVPSNPARAYQKLLEGAPVGYTCPNPAPASVDENVILKGSPNIESAKLFLNWFLSREGQIVFYQARYATPVHKDLRRKEFLPFAEEILSKEESFRDAAIEAQALAPLTELWNDLWMRSGGKR